MENIGRIQSTNYPQKKIKSGEYNYHGHVEDHPMSRHGREWGIMCGQVWAKCAQKVVVYTDKGITSGMKAGIEFAQKNNIPVEYRELYK